MLLSGKTHFFMKNNAQSPCVRALDGVAIVAGILILVSLSVDIIHRNIYQLSPGVAELQLVVCLIFVLDFLVRTMAAPNPRRYFWRNIVVLFVSIPWLNLLSWGGVALHNGVYVLLKCLPLVRALLGVYSTIRLVTPSRVSAIMWSYIALIVMLTYLSALLFYSYEMGINPRLGGFGEALWWAGLNMTTVGANIFAVTPMGKILTVLLPGLGMILFPLLTVYVTHIVKRTNV